MSQNGCTSEFTEPFALRVIGDSMAPEFEDGHIIILDPGLLPYDGAFVVRVAVKSSSANIAATRTVNGWNISTATIALSSCTPHFRSKVS